MAVLRTTSKMALRISCLQACGNDVDRAEKLYRYIAEGIDLPDQEPEEPGTMARIKAGAEDVLGWIGSHQEDLGRGLAMVQSLAGGIIPKGGRTPAAVPPLPVK